MSNYGSVANEDCTSKFPKKLSRDIYLSNDIGRDPNVDPFTTRDITKIFGDSRKLDRGATTLSYAEKPKSRHSPSPVSMLKGTGRSSSAVGSRTGTPCEGNYSPKPVEQVKTISFTKDVRWGSDRAANAATLRRDVILRQRSMELDVALQRARVDLNPPPVITEPDPWKAPSIGKFSGRKTTDSAVREGRLAAPLERFTVLPWEASKAKLAKKAVQLLLPPPGPTPSGQSKPPIAGGASTGRSVGAGKPSVTHRSMATSDSGLEEEEERWKAERTLLIQRMGLGGAGGTSRDRKKKDNARKGADFSSLASRAAPMWHQPRGQEIHDLMYKPSIHATSQARAHSAHVRLGCYSSREKLETSKPFVEVADKILQFENLLKFHERQKLNAQRSVFALPQEYSDDDDADERGVTSSSGGGAVRKRKEAEQQPVLSRIDDFSLHPESTRPPQRGLFSPQVSSSPSLFLFSDRPDPSISHVLGGARHVSSATTRRVLHEGDAGTSSPSAYNNTQGGSSPSLT